jgi:iron complex outermembrane receptor protein
MLFRIITACACAFVLLPAAPLRAQTATEPVMEHITVTGSRGPLGGGREQSILVIPLRTREANVPVTKLADLLQASPGLAYSGQGGLLQTLSIRGISGQRVANFYGDLPILTERRAGTSSSFIDPLMLETAAIVRGPASVYYGSGAVAGVLQLEPARPSGLEAQLQWGSEGDENLQYLAYGSDGLSGAVSRRSANNSKAPDGTPLNTGFEQLNAQFVADFPLAGRELNFSALVSDAEDIGKSNARYPDERITDYPRERHWIAQLRGQLGKSLTGSAYYHQQLLETRVDRPGESVDEVENSARDWGLRLGANPGRGESPLRFGMEYLGRRNVEAQEKKIPEREPAPPDQKTLDADQDSFDLYLDSARNLGALEIAGGLRWSFLSQQARGFDSERDHAPSLFLRGSWFSSDTLSFSLELASGVRFPSLAERFFSGTTGRGQVIGNPDLDPEQTLSTDLGLNWHSQGATVELHVYAMRIEDYIERLEVGPDVRSFANLGEGDILGAEAAWRISLSDALTLRAGGHYIEGEDQSGTPLADIAPAQISAGLEFQHASWLATLDYRHRFSESRVAPTEQAVGSAALLSASIGKQWTRGLKISLWGRNLLDQTWLLSTDSIAPLGARRSLGISLSWSDADS